jgi:hypothetical protein
MMLKGSSLLKNVIKHLKTVIICLNPEVRKEVHLMTICCKQDCFINENIFFIHYEMI